MSTTSGQRPEEPNTQANPPGGAGDVLGQAASDGAEIGAAAAMGAVSGGVAGAVVSGGKALAKSKTGRRIGVAVAASVAAGAILIASLSGAGSSSQAQQTATVSTEHSNQSYTVAASEYEDEETLRTIKTAASRASARWEVLAAIYLNIQDRSVLNGTGPMGIDRDKVSEDNPISDEDIDSLEESARYLGLLMNSAVVDAAPAGLNSFELDAGYQDVAAGPDDSGSDKDDEGKPKAEIESLRVDAAVSARETAAEDEEEEEEASEDSSEESSSKPIDRTPVDTEEAETIRKQIKETYVAAIATLPLEPNPDMAEDVFSAAQQWAVGKKASPQSSDQCRPGDAGGGEVKLGGETSVDLNASQKKYAQVIINRAASRGMSQNAAVIALATAMQESTLRMWWNVKVPGSEALTDDKSAKGSDGYSVGLFQQQVHGNEYSWGTVKEAMDPKKSTDMFLDRLLTIPNWESLPISQAAQRVQVSAYPDAYAKWEGMARQLVKDLKPTEGSWKDPHSAKSVKAMASSFSVLSVPAKKEPEKETGKEELKLPSRLVINPNITPDAQAAENAVGSRFHESISAWGDVRAGGDDHGQKRAVDFMIKDYKSPAGIKGGDEIAAFLIANEKSLGVEYLIWRDKIWLGSTTGWKNYSTGGYGGMYTGNWNDTTLHNDHVHLTVYGNKGTGGDLKYESPDGVSSPCASGNAGVGTGTGAGNGDDYPFRDPKGVCGYCSNSIDPWSMYMRECVSFVAWRMNQQMGWKEGQPYPFTKATMGIGNAYEWSGALAARGYITDSNPTVGAIAWWQANVSFGVVNTGSAGHVGVVAEILQDGNIVVEQYNGPGSEWAYSKMTLHKSKVSGFIHVADVSQKKPDVKAEE